jgi:type IV pilus assembly protein PilO
MSTAVVVPPPNSSSLLRRVPRLTAQARRLLTAVNLHFAGVAALVVLDLFLLAHLLFAWQDVNASDPSAMAQQGTMLRAAQIAARPLQGIDDKLAASTTQGNDFYQHRLPYAFSQVLTELGSLTARENVRLSRVQYQYFPVLNGTYALTEVGMDASIAGDYRSVVGAINALERDRLFFTIGSINLTGQQTGQVNLRLHLRTFLRAAGPNETAGEPPANITAEPVPAVAAPGGAQ